ncbi:unnamed protein product [Echinostoma caproni]|uniref:Enolase_N domain-containing protein n=1 Tax=Echinostoma caproni TaxID=27848 RepID=A0A183BBE9_9TREM|nr:unnamed protein product [Echinostoma caproni]
MHFPLCFQVHIQSWRRGVPEPCGILYAPRGKSDLQDHEKSHDKCTKDVCSVNESAVSERIVLGYVQEGGYDYSIGRGAGLGFISLAALIRAATTPGCNSLRDGFSRVLMKNPKSTCRRIAHLSLVTCPNA